MHEAFDIQRYPQPWITYAITLFDAGNLITDTWLAYSLREAQETAIQRLSDWRRWPAGRPVAPEGSLSFSDREEFINRLNEAASSEGVYGKEVHWHPHPNPGPWAQAERDQLFTWLYSFARRYIDLEPMEPQVDDSYVDYRSTFPVLTIWRGEIEGRSEMSVERLVELLSQEEGIEVDTGEPFEDDEGEWQLLRVRFVRELPDGSPEALGLNIVLDLKTPRGGRPPVLHGRWR